MHNNCLNSWLFTHLRSHHRRHQCPSWRSSSWRARDGHHRRETSDWSQCASESPDGRWMMECWPPGEQEIENCLNKLGDKNIKIFDYHNLKIRTDDILLVCPACHLVTVAGPRYSDKFVIVHDIDLSGTDGALACREIHTCFLTRMCLCLIRTRAWWMDLASPSLKTW